MVGGVGLRIAFLSKYVSLLASIQAGHGRWSDSFLSTI
jgi:hypothetical protein